MAEEPSKNGISTWPALRQIEALKDSIARTISNNTLPSNETVTEWLAKNNMPPLHADKFPIGAISASMDLLRRQLLGEEEDKQITESGTRAHFQSVDDFGSERSGAGWNRCDNFVITSAFIRLLGAWEQYELDVLKALFYYRPDGRPLGPPEEWTEKLVEEHVIRELPELKNKKEIYTKPPLWTWMVKQAGNRHDRRNIFKNVFGIKFAIGTKKEKDENNKNRNDWYDKRNKIAHGRSDVEILLDEYVRCEALVCRSILHLAKECKEKQKLII